MAGMEQTIYFIFGDEITSHLINTLAEQLLQQEIKTIAFTPDRSIYKNI